MCNDKELERKAKQAHDIWSHWMRYFFKVYCQSMGSGCAVFVVPMSDYTRWMSQMKTSYEDLSEKEKESDREIAKLYLR